jgi:TPR repeat protein
MLVEGRGVAADLEEARRWFARASEAGVLDAEVSPPNG